MFGTSIWRDIKYEFQRGNVISQLIIVNVAVFLAVNLYRVILLIIGYDLPEMKVAFDNFLAWLAVPYDLKTLLYRPWTVISNMFLHYAPMHIFWNMLIFFFFGRIFQEFLGNKRILALYIYSGIAGVILSVGAYNLIPMLQKYSTASMALGASASVMGMVLATATIVPDYTVFLLLLGPVRLKFIALFYVIIDLVSISYFDNTGGHIAHLGGALFGYIFIKQLQAGHDWSLPFNNAVGWTRNLFRSKKQPHVVYKTKQEQRKKPRTDDTSINKQQQVDSILDKIARSGYDSLTKEEKEFLFKVSKEQ